MDVLEHRGKRRLAYEILKRKHPVILGCDANTKETCFTYRVLASHMTNAAREIGWRINNTPPSGAAQDTRIGRLDYLFFTPEGVTPSTVYRIKDTAGSGGGGGAAHVVLFILTALFTRLASQ